MKHGQFVGSQYRALFQAGFRKGSIFWIEHKIGREQIMRDIGGNKQAE